MLLKKAAGEFCGVLPCFDKYRSENVVYYTMRTENLSLHDATADYRHLCTVI